MANEPLAKYIKQQLAAGHSAEEIRTHLVGYGYPVREIEEVLEFVARPAKPKQQPVQEKPTSETPEKTERAERKEEEMDVFEMFKNWFLSLILPMRVFEEQAGKASFSKGFMNVLSAGTLGGLIIGLVQLIKVLTATVPVIDSAGFMGLTGKLGSVVTINMLFMAPLGAMLIWLTISSLFYLFTIMIGGTGTFRVHSYLISIFTAPLTLILLMLNLVPSKCALFIIYLVFGIFAIYPLMFALKEAHKLDTLRTILSLAIPLVLVIILLIPVLKILPGTLSAIC